MSLKNPFLAGYQIVSIILQERSSLCILHTFSHDLHQTHHGCGLPVSLRTESVSLLHQSLNGKARQLLQGTQIAEMGHDGMVIFLLQEAFEADLNPCLNRYMTAELCRIPALVQNLVLRIILFHQRIDISLAHIFHVSRNLVNGISVNLPAELHLGFHLIALRNRHIPHIVGHAHHADMAGLHNAHCRAHPSCQTLQYILVTPVPHNHLALDAHAGHDMAVLPVSMGRLVLIHEIHVNAVVGNLHIKLCMEMAQRLMVLLQAQNPGLGGRESMHPGDNARAFAVHIRLIEQAADHLVGKQGGLPDQLIGQDAGFIDFFHNDS